MAALLKDFLAEEALHPWSWGEYDCTMMVCRWINARLNKFPAFDLCRQYKTWSGAKRILTRNGGMIEFADRVALEMGIQKTSTPIEGDVGVINAQIEINGSPRNLDVMAICIRDLWCARAMHGLIAFKCEHKIAWGIPWLH